MTRVEALKNDKSRSFDEIVVMVKYFTYIFIDQNT